MANYVTKTAIEGAWIHIKICTLPLLFIKTIKYWVPSIFPPTARVSPNADMDGVVWSVKTNCVECTGTYGPGLLRYFQNAGLEVHEVTAPDRMEQRQRGKSDTIDTECAAHAAFS